MTAPARNIAALDTPLPVLNRRIADLKRDEARARVEASAARLRSLLAHPDEFPHVAAPEGERAEYAPLLHDADPDSTTAPIDIRTGGTA